MMDVRTIQSSLDQAVDPAVGFQPRPPLTRMTAVGPQDTSFSLKALIQGFLKSKLSRTSMFYSSVIHRGWEGLKGPLVAKCGLSIQWKVTHP